MTDSIIQSITIAKPGDIAIVSLSEGEFPADDASAIVDMLKGAGLVPIFVADGIEVRTSTPSSEQAAAPTPDPRFVPARLTVDGAPSILDRSMGMVAPFLSDDVRDSVMQRLNDGSSSTYPFSWTPAPHEAEQ